MKKLSLTFIILLFFISACVSPAAPATAIPSKTLSPSPTVTPTPSPAISPADWASNESGVVAPEKMFPLVGAVDKKHRRTIDLEYMGLRLVVVLGEGVDLLSPKLISNHREIRSFYAVELNKQETLLDQLGEVKAILDKQEVTQDSVVIIEGQNWSADLSIPTTVAYIFQVVEFGKNKQDEIRARYTWKDEILRQLLKEELPQLLPRLQVNGPYIERVDTSEKVWLKGVAIPVTEDDLRGNSIFNHVRLNVEANEKLGLYSNFVRLTSWTDNWDTTKTEDLLHTVDYLESKGIYVTFTAHNDQRNVSNNNYFMPNEKDKQTIIDAYTALKDKSNIVIGIWNEPDTGWNVGWGPWTNVLSEMYPKLKRIYEGKTMPPVLVPGIGWARDHRNSIIPLPEGSYIIDVHPYPIPTGPTTYIHIDDMWTHEIGRHPILMTELSGVVHFEETDRFIAEPQSPEDIENIQHVLEYVNDPKYKYMIGYALWTGTAGWDGVRRGTTRLVRRGEVMFEERNDPEFAPTDFRK